ncbi:unnamed protein product [Cylicocyclus nassatus]|uniref:Uncharacterized protein n=1 Tax=Cylicocyclus nassatus TaxID=53992 RepID=A0AA36GNG2_CYLNA|nr:unnamed protein product [Cylicocyclus nassatus]
MISNISFDFDLPNLHVHFIAPANSGCEIFICKRLSTAEDCHRKKTEADVTTAVFKKIKPAELYYMTGTCTFPQGRGPLSPWIKIITPTKTKRTTPKEISLQSSGINAELKVDEGLNVELIWGFSFSNGSKFHVHYVKNVELIVYRKRRSESEYAAEKTKEKGVNGRIRLGLSPSYTFTLGCFFYAMNATFLDDTKLFISTDEICYTMLSASFLFTYILAALLIVLALVGIAMSSRMPRYAGDKRDETSSKRKSQKEPSSKRKSQKTTNAPKKR